MAHGTTFAQDNKKVFFVEMKKDAKKEGIDFPHFRIVESLGNKKYSAPSQDAFIEGNVIDIKVVEKEYEGKRYDVVSMILEDDEERMFVNIPMSGLGRSTINSLAGVKGTIQTVKINLYTNKAGYASVFILVNGEKCEWRWTPEEIKAKIITTTDKKGNTTSNFDLLDEMILSEIPLIKNKLVEKSELEHLFGEEMIKDEPVIAPKADPKDDLPF